MLNEEGEMMKDERKILPNIAHHSAFGIAAR